ncbi:hypothetical protein HPB52_021457 [Rhipicephalus sanguineus]|uniref:Uncharacterized protein n=1 Tax=Rhipicephalus sanguineus TaxID=34632 RepID=A0A9D4PSG4_RHISA|nr:hypothetical protein HPB52_021457 [Rhipicephalus sanguineus]
MAPNVIPPVTLDPEWVRLLEILKRLDTTTVALLEATEVPTGGLQPTGPLRTPAPGDDQRVQDENRYSAADGNAMPVRRTYSSDFTELNALPCWIDVVIPSQRLRHQVTDNTCKLGRRCHRYQHGRTDPIMVKRFPRHVRRTLSVHQRPLARERDSIKGPTGSARASLGLAAPSGAP